MQRQRVILPALMCLLCGCTSARGAPPAATQSDVQIDFRGARNLGNETTDQHGRPFTVRGLSGVAWLGGEDFVAVMDNSDKLVRLRIRFNDTDGSIASADYAGGVTLAESHDFEGIALIDRDTRGRVLLSEEDTPAVREFSLSDGAQTSVLPTPRVFRPPNLRPNLGFEALCATNKGADVWTMNEGALTIDGDAATVNAGSVVRLLHFRRDNAGTYRAAEQFAYVADTIHKPHAADDRSLSRNGVVELVALPDGRLMAVERSLSVNGPRNVFSDFRNSLYLIDTAGATNVSAEPFASGLRGKSYGAVTKTLVWSHTGLVIGNMEGLCVGPQIAPNTWVMVGVVDNNGLAMVANRVIAFTLRIGAGGGGTRAAATQP